MASPSLLVTDAAVPDREAERAATCGSAAPEPEVAAEPDGPDRDAVVAAIPDQTPAATDLAARLEVPGSAADHSEPPAPAKAEAVLVDRLLEAALAGHSPDGGPRLTRSEIDLLRGGDGPVKHAVVRARVAEWGLGQATDEEQREAARARAAAVDATLTEFELERFERNDTSGREIYAAHAALKRALGAGINLVALASENEHKRRTREAEAEAAKTGRGEAELARWREASARTGAATPMTPRRIATWSSAVLAALALAWAIHPPALPTPPAAPAALALSTELGLRDVHLVGRIVFAASDSWNQMDETARQRLATDSCARAQALGFDGLVLFDATNERVATCVGAGDGGLP